MVVIPVVKPVIKPDNRLIVPTLMLELVQVPPDTIFESEVVSPTHVNAGPDMLASGLTLTGVVTEHIPYVV